MDKETLEMDKSPHFIIMAENIEIEEALVITEEGELFLGIEVL